MGLSLASLQSLFAAQEDMPDTWAGIGIHSTGVSAVVVQRLEAPVVLRWGYEALVEGEVVPHAIARLVEKLELSGLPCVTWLNEYDYQIRLVEAPDVEQADLIDALNWQAQELFDSQDENLVIEAIEFPGTEDRKKQLYMIGGNHNAISIRSNMLLDGGCRLRCIDIPELCQRNIAELIRGDQRSLVLLSFTHDSCLITITREDVLYMTRRLMVGMDDLQTPEERRSGLEQIMVELQRSLDYFTSHLRQPPVEKVYLAPVEMALPEVAEAIREQLYLEPVQLDLSRLLLWETEMSERMQARFFHTIGAALRLEPFEIDEPDELTEEEDIFG